MNNRFTFLNVMQFESAGKRSLDRDIELVKKSQTSLNR